MRGAMRTQWQDSTGVWLTVWGEQLNCLELVRKCFPGHSALQHLAPESKRSTFVCKNSLNVFNNCATLVVYSHCSIWIYLPLMVTSWTGNTFALLALREGNPPPMTGGFPSQRHSDETLKVSFILPLANWMDGPWPVIWDVMPLMWRHVNVKNKAKWITWILWELVE